MPQAVKVGLFTTVALVVLAVLILRIEDIHLFGRGQARRIEAVFTTIAGLDDKAAVRVAGVRIGRVDGIRLEGRQAVVTLLLERPVELTVGARARIANMGLLGDKYVELVLGPADAPPLPEGTQLMGSTPVSFDEAIAKLDRIGDSIGDLTGSLAGGPGGENKIALLVDNLTSLASDLRSLVAANRAEVTSTIANLDRASGTLAAELPEIGERMQEVLTKIAAVLDDNRGNLRESMGNARELTEKLQVSVANLNEITGKIARGEGTIGKLVNSDQAHDELVSTLDSIQGGVKELSGALGGITRIGLDLGLESYYLQDSEDARSGFHLDVDPKGGRLYRFGFFDTPVGVEHKQTQLITVTHPDGSVETQTVETVKRNDSPTVTALVGFPGPRDLRLWTGLIDSEFGAQVDYPLVDRRLLLSFEAFDFNNSQSLDPHLRLSGRWMLSPTFYLVGGYDDFLNRRQDSVFLGAGIRWKEDDLKYLLGSAPKF